MIAEYLLERVRDVGLALYECRRYDLAVGRLQLQKLSYLVDVVSVCVGIVPTKDGHVTYLHGPYDRKVQTAADVLAFHGLARVTDVELREGGIASKYVLSATGCRWVEQLISDSPMAGTKRRLAAAVVDALARRNAFYTLRQLVYAEPVFVQSQKNGYMFPLTVADITSNTAALIVALIGRGIGSGDSRNPEFIADLFIEVLTLGQRLSISVTEED